MKQILRTRGKGKTFDLVKLAIENNAIVVTPCNLKYIQEIALKHFGKEVRAITFSDFVKIKGCHDENFVIDNIEECIRLLALGNKVIGISMNIE